MELIDGGRDPVFSPDGTKVAYWTDDAHAPLDTNGIGDVYVHDYVSGTTVLVSVNAAGTNGGDGSSTTGLSGSTLPGFSPDGSKLAFDSRATDLGPPDSDPGTDPYGEVDAFVRDLNTGVTTMVSTIATGSDSGNNSSYGYGFTTDGALLFTGTATDLGFTDNNGGTDVFLRDLASDTTSLVSANAAGTGTGSQASYVGDLSPDGTKVSITTKAGDLGAPDTNGVEDVYVHDLVTGTLTLASANTAGTGSGNNWSSGARFSGDGTMVAFSSYATDLVGVPDSNHRFDVFVRDLTTGTTTLASSNVAGTATANGQSYYPVVSPDGTKVAFISDATDHGPPDTNGQWDVYVRDLAAATTTMVSVNAAGTNGGNDYSGEYDLAFSPDGTKVAFESDATDLGPKDTNTCPVKPTDPTPPCRDVYVRDLAANTTSLASSIGGDSIPATSSGRPRFHPVDNKKLIFEGTDTTTWDITYYLATAD